MHNTPNTASQNPSAWTPLSADHRDPIPGEHPLPEQPPVPGEPPTPGDPVQVPPSPIATGEPRTGHVPHEQPPGNKPMPSDLPNKDLGSFMEE